MDKNLVVYEGHCVYNISNTHATFLIEERDGAQREITIPTFNYTEEFGVSNYQCLQDDIEVLKKAFKELPISTTQISTTIVLVDKKHKRYGIGIVPGIIVKRINYYYTSFTKEKLWS